MLVKKKKLNWKEINYILKRWKRAYGEVFIFHIIKQYPNNKYHQWAIQIPKKIEKRATMRNLLKRKMYDMIPDYVFSWSGWYKIFISVNKKQSAALVEHIATHDKVAILQYRSTIIDKDFAILAQSLQKFH